MEAKEFLQKLLKLISDADEDEPAKPAKKGKAKPAEEESFDDEPEADDDDDDAPDEEEKLTREDVRKAMVAYQKKTSPEKARQLLKSFGANTLGELDEDKYQKVIKKTKA